ncbi:MSMEG_4193 family putative phosphomutase [Tsukamurella sp. 8F]|uniref:MSMEG_4193 family putative phosphomutase n=1 Tax=unclassified Tsukamurella TaxID=2633480 RepID=UPI0023B908CE|nr:MULTISPECIES: MSMEG_4193 family putative phosphomutase [unclassified Tsukamurella]MDF0530521.1 MSMEG_4193 family putative phosphomutase [Tsukamurella sp. 8J]MDF0586829.1 MSMEG_4193 family putative phosphomutase [Tsukamurella sp. 8F]
MTVILIRHGRSTANTSGVLAGRTPGVALDDVGRAQADDLVTRLGGVEIVAAVRSPLLRCEQTLAPLLSARALDATVDDRLAEVDYGSWTGRKIGELLNEPLWKVVQQQPSAAEFPGGEALAQVQARAVAAVRAHDRAVTAEFGPDAVWVACSHGDVIKAIVADAVGSHLDQFQRIVVNPASTSVVTYGEHRPVVHWVNNSTGPAVLPKRKPEEATVGGERGV